MKNSTSLERSKLQLTMMARLHDVFADIKDEVEITPEYIQDTLGQFMQVATGSDYPFSKSVRIGFGEVKQVQPYQLADEVKRAINATESKSSDDNRLNNFLSREMALCLDDVLHRYVVWEKVESENEVLKIARTLHHAFSEYRKDNNYIIYGLPVLKRMISFGVNWADDEESLKLLLRKNCLTIKKALNVF
ncbi:hypothetical protein [Xenorhabdus eapokensis]|uniref:Uncharacterized protein n=1 Tax=Xenorhabdus eapokensis TaxID=1873482 RepID=A0A1Q5TUJ0_9GAMM|nr:hypothetical protein [Xenorhabdus eapokensis]OKP03902.1 hypothetical protein Xedl_01420 [Xenorhabdus eapokensis]